MKTIKLIGLTLVLTLNIASSQAAINLGNKCSFFDANCEWPPDSGGGDPIPLDMLEFFEMSDRIWQADRPKDKLKQRPAHLGQWQTKIYTKQNTDSSIPGHFVDDGDYSFVNLFLQGPRNHDALAVYKSRTQRNWFKFYPAGNDFYLLSVSGIDAQGKYQPDLGLLYIDPATPSQIRIGLVRGYDWVPPVPLAPWLKPTKMETPGLDLYLLENTLDRSAYLFRVHEAGDGEGFFLEHSSGKWIGAPNGIAPEWLTSGGKAEEILTYGLLQMVQQFTPKEQKLFTFRLCDALQKGARTCVKF